MQLQLYHTTKQHTSKSGVIFARPVNAATDPSITYLGSEVNESTLYATYFVDCDIDGQIAINVTFTTGGGYATKTTCNAKITTPGVVKLATLTDAAGMVRSANVIGNPPTPVNRLFLPMISR